MPTAATAPHFPDISQRGVSTPVISTGPRVNDILSSAKSIYVSGFAAEVAHAPALFRQHPPKDATVTGMFSPLINHHCYADPAIGMRVRSFFLTKQVKQQLAMGLVDYCPWRYGVIDRWLSAPGRFDTALIMMSPPDQSGKCSLGVQVDFLPSFIDRIERIVGFINPKMPRTVGDTLVDYATLAGIVDYDVPLLTMAQRPPDTAALAIARIITNLVPDEATVQFGIGQIPSQVLRRLGDHRGLRIHSGVIDDHILALEASGALDRDQPIVTGTAVGPPELYDALGDAQRFSFRCVAHTHSYRTIVGLKRFTAINSVVQVDLLGQASAEASAGKLIASPGGSPDFARGALDSEGGQSIVAVRARGVAGHASGIVPLLDVPTVATSGAVDADVIVSEFGVAHVRNLSLDERAEAIIAIAASEDQEFLSREWTRIRDRFFGLR